MGSIALATACTSPSTEPEEGSPPPFGDGKLHDVEPPSRDPPAAALPGSALFTRDQVLEVHLTLAAADLLALEEHGNEEVYKPAQASISGAGIGRVELGQVGMRHKGAYTLHHCWDNALKVRSREGSCAKLSLKLDFAEYEKETRLDGLKRLNLHASSNDATRLHELMAYELFRDFDVDAPRTAVAEVFVNGAPWGLFIAVEAIDGRYTKAHFAEGGGDGNLYKEIWPSAGLDPEELSEALVTNEEVGDVSAFIGFAGAVEAASPERFAADIAPWLEVEHLLRYIAVDRALANWDGIMAFYAPSRPHNFYWYHDGEGSGRFQLIPWDLDNTLWPFDPFMAPQQWVTAAPVPDWNVEPRDCNPRPVWEADGSTAITPPRCDLLLDRLAESEWARFEDLAEALLAGPFETSRLIARARHHAALLEPIIAADPYIELWRWRADSASFENTLEQAVANFRAFVAAGLRGEEPAPPSEPEASLGDGGLDVSQVNDFESSLAQDAAVARLYSYGSPGSDFAAALNLTAPIEGDRDLRFDFTFTRQPGSWNEWVNLWLETAGGVTVDLRDHSTLLLSMRADRSRVVRVRLNSPAYDDTFGGAWSEFGMDVVVSSTAESFALPLDAFGYPDWAREAWSAGQGWLTSDAEALAVVLSRANGLVFNPSATFDAAGELASESEDGFLQIDSIELR